jgi:hypothetical protein
MIVIGSVSSSWGPHQMMVDNEMEHIPIAGDQSERARENVPIRTISLLQRWFYFEPNA